MMLQTHNIKAILFDSGRVLNNPRTGHWFVPPNFCKYVDMNKFKLLNKSMIGRAFDKASKNLDEKKLILTETEEFHHFIEFYRIFSNELPELELCETSIIGLAKDTVYNDEKFLFPEDVFQVIPKLHKKYKLGVVSDTWPSLERVFKSVGLRDYFSTFVMSSIMGVSKPDKLMFNTALFELNVKPEEVLFIDDNIKNLEGASKLGIKSILMIRDKNVSFNSEYKIIRNLNDLIEFLKL